MKHAVPINISLLVLGAAMIMRTALADEGASDNNQANAAELAKKLQNPIANLISVPVQNNWDFGIGPADAMRFTANVQPVIPFSISDNWNLITRTIMPIIHAESPLAGGSSSSGLGDIVQSFFLSPKEAVGGWIVGGGPVFLYPTASENTLGGQKWGAGPTAVALRQQNGWTYGMLANHLWDFAGNASRADINATFMQPFVSYTTKTYTTVGVNTESTYDWESSRWTVPLNLTVQQLVKFGSQPVAFTVGGRYYAEKPEGGPDWGLRFAVTLLFPK
ncbi:MAG: hypothetical protein LUQ11_05400 [Methylococcaceae bacterium]|nr:hypothetical protein [Methylococcaceae bacterium]